MAVHPQHEDVWSRTTTVGGYAADEVRSVLQKSIRRGLVEEAVLAAYELYETGPESEDMLWRRLEIIATEDVGYGLIEAPALIEALNAQRQRIPPTADRWIFAVHAVRLLATAPKDRTSTDLAMWAKAAIARGERKLEVPDFCVDYHTRRGTAMGRGPLHWLTEGGGVLENERTDIPNPWKAYVQAQTQEAAIAAGH